MSENSIEMSSLELLSAFDEIAKEQPELGQVMQEVAAAYKETEQLERENADINAARLHLFFDAEMLRDDAERLAQNREDELEMLRDDAERLAQNREDELELERQVMKMYKSTLELEETLKTIDLANTVSVDWVPKHWEMLEGMQRLKEEYKRKRERLMLMENRVCMKELRKLRAEVAAAKEDLERAKRATADEAAALKSKLSVVEAQTNALIADLDEGGKELEALRDELKKCKEACEGNTSTQGTVGLSSMYSQERAMTSTQHTPTPSLMDQHLKTPSEDTFKFPAFSDFFGEMKKTRTFLEPAPPVPLVSILKKPQTDGAQEHKALETQHKSVLFLTPVPSPSPSISSLANSVPEPSKLVITKQEPLREFSDAPDVAMSVSDEEIADNAEATIEMDTMEVAEPTIAMEATPDLDAIQEDKTHPKAEMEPPLEDSKDASRVQKPKVHVIECRTIKPPGTPLPQKLPTDLTPSEEERSPGTAGGSSQEAQSPALQTNRCSADSELDFMRQLVLSADGSGGTDKPATPLTANIEGFERSLEMSFNSPEGNDFKFSSPDGKDAPQNDGDFNLEFSDGGWQGDSQNNDFSLNF